MSQMNGSHMNESCHTALPIIKPRHHEPKSVMSRKSPHERVTYESHVTNEWVTYDWAVSHNPLHQKAKALIIKVSLVTYERVIYERGMLQMKESHMNESCHTALPTIKPRHHESKSVASREKESHHERVTYESHVTNEWVPLDWVMSHNPLHQRA